ncbi:CLUMA_CG005504, isoform A [Clunio marinus]|uniref:CLUMA_CG005504, isoform A n=1 Tax=Clunio marinus TaxID=568069 RepID=A0A1J1HX02_9DIPT|nr:CLUMA_CG005504, isoform A [Clunio marinus]
MMTSQFRWYLKLGLYITTYISSFGFWPHPDGFRIIYNQWSDFDPIKEKLLPKFNGGNAICELSKSSAQCKIVTRREFDPFALNHANSSLQLERNVQCSVQAYMNRTENKIDVGKGQNKLITINGCETYLEFIKESHQKDILKLRSSCAT